MPFEAEYKILAEFEFIVDLDYAMYSMIKAKYSESIYVNRRIFKLTDDVDIKKLLINRDEVNPLVKFFPGMDTNSLYHQILDDNEEELLQYAGLYDSFRLLVAFQERASSVKSITILCRNQIEADFVSKFNSSFSTVISDKESIDTSEYNILYLKYFNEAIRYKNLTGKAIYIANAKYNYDKQTNLINPDMVVLFADSNEIKLIDLYLNPKYIQKEI